jgi:hypothetical protein
MPPAAARAASRRCRAAARRCSRRRQPALLAIDAAGDAVREASVPLVLVLAGAALLSASLAQAERRGARVRTARPPLTRTIGLVSRRGPRSPAARASTALATAGDEDHQPT